MKFFSNQPILLWVYMSGGGGDGGTDTTSWFNFPLIMLRLKELIKELFMFLYL